MESNFGVYTQNNKGKVVQVGQIRFTGNVKLLEVILEALILEETLEIV